MPDPHLADRTVRAPTPALAGLRRKVLCKCVEFHAARCGKFGVGDEAFEGMVQGLDGLGEGAVGGLGTAIPGREAPASLPGGSWLVGLRRSLASAVPGSD